MPPIHPYQVVCLWEYVSVLMPPIHPYQVVCLWEYKSLYTELYGLRGAGDGIDEYTLYKSGG